MIAAALALLAATGSEVLATQYAQDRIADSVRRDIGLDSAPQVHVNGFPVSLQLARKVINEADIDATQVPATLNGRVLTIQDLAIHLHGIRQEQSGREQADEAEVTATMAYEDLSTFYGVDINRGNGDDQVVATTHVPLLGQVSASAHVGVAGSRAIGVNDVRLSDNVPPAARTLLEKALERQAPLDNLPEGLALQSVAVTDQGIVALMTGHDVRLRPRTAQKPAQVVQASGPADRAEADVPAAIKAAGRAGRDRR
ncbi:LmeA family phospholipid-binding protein [Streptomyces sp. SID4920]|nr:LmeA family phospholipid-binding protein [Streptomyces sp. SID4920]MYX68639.1 LmeA family phospholipid-binding protein [Streptomyces sp. SID8373]